MSISKQAYPQIKAVLVTMAGMTRPCVHGLRVGEKEGEGEIDRERERSRNRNTQQQ